MERLTQRIDGYLNIWGRTALYEAVERPGAYLNNAIVRLAAYEDTGMAPEEVKDLIYRFEKCRAVRVALCDSTGRPIAEPSHIRNLLQAEKDGRLVVLPCKVGDILYEVDLPEYGVITCKVFSISYYNGPMFHVPGNEAVKSLTAEVEVIEGHGKGSSYNFEIDDFGKTIFLTRQAAETALREEAENA